MNDETNCLLIQSIIINPNLTTNQKINIIKETLKDQPKQKDKIKTNTIIESTPNTKKTRKKSTHSKAFIEKHTPNQLNLKASMKADSEGRY